MSNSLLVRCACCDKLVITKHKSKRRTCSHACYMVLWRADKRAAEIAAQKALTAEQAVI
ncbi:hypothetical protein D3C80_1133290 [compost metagenome]